MFTNKVKSVLFFLICSISFNWSTCFAIGLGDSHVFSSLNEPLNFEIDIIDFKESQINFINANLASAKDFARAGIERPFWFNKLNFEVVKHGKQAVVYITTNEIIKEPFIEILVELDWPEGKLVKSYSVFLDPGLIKDKANAKSIREPLIAKLQIDKINPKAFGKKQKDLYPKAPPIVLPKKIDNKIFNEDEDDDDEDEEEASLTIKDKMQEKSTSELTEEELLAKIESEDEENPNLKSELKKEKTKELLKESEVKSNKQPIALDSEEKEILKAIVKEEKREEVRDSSMSTNELLFLIVLPISIVLLIAATLLKYIQRKKAARAGLVKPEYSKVHSVKNVSKTNLAAESNSSSNLFSDIDLPSDVEESLDLLASNEDEVNLKLDLAKQYMDAGDNITAKEVLLEILKIASSDKKDDINRMLQSMA